ncbi:PAS domain S-box protein [Catellatospora coxensis]
MATVMCALVMLVWILWLPAGSPRADPPQFVVTLLASATALVGLTAGVKLLLSGFAPFTMAAGLPLAAAAIVGSWSLFNLFNLSSEDARFVSGAQVTTAFLYAIAARVQLLRMGGRPSGLTAHKRRSYSRLPYLAIVSANIMLLAVLWHEGFTARGWGMVIGSAVITGLVIWRQHLAFADNALLTERIKAGMRDMNQQKRRFRSLVQHASDLTLLVDRDRAVRYASPALIPLLGVDPRQAVGRQLQEVLRADDPAAAERLTAEATSHRDGARMQLPAHHTDGTQRWLEALATNRLADDSVSGFIINIRDVTEARVLEDELRHEATHDRLTGLLNRSLLEDFARNRAAVPQGPGAAC